MPIRGGRSSVSGMKVISLAVVLALVPLTIYGTEEPAAPPDVAAPPEDATCTESGLCTKVLAAGAGAVRPNAWDGVTVHYSGWTTDGKLFDSSLMRGKPATFPLSQVIPGWTEELQLMVVGEQRRLLCQVIENCI